VTISADGVERDGFQPGDVVVVTGGGGGFGRAFSQRFAAGGARVAVWDVIEETGQETAALAKKAGGEARFFKVDLSSPAQIAKAVAATIKAFGNPYCLINNASIYPRGSVLKMDLETWERTFKINITAPWLLAKAFAPAMIERKRGVIINIASGRALEGTPNGANYACTKAAILSLTKTLALEWAKSNVRCNAIVPGVSLTAQPLEATTLEELIARGKARIPLGRIGYPEDMAGLAWFLASRDAAYMTGQGVVMNGGVIMEP
jgi:NAD(P)-dependent dehydrogenase (short-subunit alcohol dehydrogenase family)